MPRSEDKEEGPGGTLQASSSNTQLLELSSQMVSTADLLDEQAAAADDSGIQLPSRHLHFHMHMHAAPPMHSLHVAVPSTLPQLAPQGRQEWPASAKNSLSISSITAANEFNAQQLTAKQHGSKLQQEPGEAPASVPQRRSRWRRLLRATAITGAATAVALTGAGIAAAALAPRMEHLETRYHQVCQQQEALHQHTSQLADAKQELQQQLTALLEQQNQLQHYKQQLQQQVQLLQEQQEEHLGDKLQLQHRIEQLQASQQQLQETSAQLAVEVGAATDKLQQQSTCSSAGPADHTPSSSSSTSQQHQGDSVGGATGDLKLQLTVSGFTDALVTRIGEAELVPKFAEALVNQVKETSLVQHTVEGLAARVGRQVAGVVCPWRWSMPWQRRQQQTTEGQDE